jgi:hypothetical protein
MNRRRALAGIAGAVGGIALANGADAEQPKVAIPGATNFELGKDVRLGATSTPIKANGSELHIVGIGTGSFQLDDDPRLTATLKAAVTQYAKVNYWISTAVFDAAGKLLGTASHKEPDEYERLGATPTVFRNIKLDFGISKAFKKAALVVVAISEPDIPKPG